MFVLVVTRGFGRFLQSNPYIIKKRLSQFKGLKVLDAFSVDLKIANETNRFSPLRNCHQL